MSAGISLEELLAWNNESARFWRAHLDANPSLLELPCDIGGTANVQEFVRHIWGVELRWSQRLAGVPVLDKENTPQGPLEALFDLHLKAMEMVRGFLDGGIQNWDETIDLDLAWVPPDARQVSRRKIAAHLLTHSQRHWAQLATLVRAAGFPSGFKGDLFFSAALI